jgi:ribosomal protein S18 acetylase RimI-like enzyme
MMRLYKEYLKLNGKELIEEEHGYLTYYQVNDGLYIEDIFVDPGFRKNHIASSLADKVTKAAWEIGLRKLYVSVRPSYQHSTESLKVLLAYGFKLKSSGVDAIYFEKEI